jgi:putative peptidoglycan lipid II flippase
VGFLKGNTELKNSDETAAEAALKAEAAARHSQEKSSVAVSALIFALGTLASRILGLFRDMITARYFPVDVRDAFFNAFRLPNLFRRVLGEGSLSVSFIPIFVEILSGKKTSATESELRAKSLVGGVFSILMSVSIAISCLAIIFMDDMLRVLLSGQEYMSVPGKFELTVRLGRIMFAFLILISLYAFFMAILQSMKKFAMTALAPCFFNLALIAAALFSPRVAAPETVLAWSVIVGGFLQMAVLVPGVVKSGYFPRFTFKWNTPEILRVLKAVIPSTFGMSVMQITALVNMHFASRLPSGSHTYLYLADRILELPLSMFVVSVGSALLPTLAAYWAEGNREGMADTINHYIRLIIFVALPAALGMFVLAQPITEVLFMGREFSYDDAVKTSQVIQVYAFSVIVAAGVRILAQGFYAIQNTWFPAVAGSVALVSHILFAYALTKTFGLRGLAAASVLSATVNLLMLATAYNSWVGSLQVRKLGMSFAKFLVCGAVMVGSLQLYEPLLGMFGGRYVSRAFLLLGMIAIGAFAYMATAHFMRIPEYSETAATFGGKLKRKIGRFAKK